VNRVTTIVISAAFILVLFIAPMLALRFMAETSWLAAVLVPAGAILVNGVVIAFEDDVEEKVPNQSFFDAYLRARPIIWIPFLAIVLTIIFVSSQ